MIEYLLKLEMSLWIPETRNNEAYMDRVLHDDFIEFGKSGKIYNKSDIVGSRVENLETKFPFNNLNVKQIDESSFLVTYVATTVLDGVFVTSNRSSIWIGKKNFQLLFHQGTLVNEKKQYL